MSVGFEPKYLPNHVVDAGDWRRGPLQAQAPEWFEAVWTIEFRPDGRLVFNQATENLFALVPDETMRRYREVTDLNILRAVRDLEALDGELE